MLADGKARTAEEIVAEAVKLDLLSANIPAHQLYIALIEYITRARGVGRVPQIVQDEGTALPPQRAGRRLAAAGSVESTIDRIRTPKPIVAALRTTGSGMDGTAFEIAACDAFVALGVIAEHVGGQAAPDAKLDFPLGVRAYRAVLECKTARGDVANPDAAEAANIANRTARNSRHSSVRISQRETVISELHAHDVSAWTIDDIAELLAIGADLEEMRPLFAAGFVADRIATIRWNREHGAAKRIAFICETLLKLGWQAQQHAPDDASNAALLTQDAAMMLVDGYLAASGAPVACSREDVVVAFEYLTSPLIGRAMWATAAKEAIIVTGKPS